MKFYNVFIFLLLSIAFISCDKDDDDMDSPSDALITTSKTSDVSTTVLNLQTTIESEGFNLVKTVNHSMAAAGVGLELRPTQVIIFGNPEGGTQLMQENQRVGIDLPLKVLVYEDENGTTQVSYYNASTMADRYDLNDSDELITNINAKLATITGSGNPEEGEELLDATLFLKTKETEMNVDVLYNKVKTEIEARGFTIVQEVNHDMAAANIGLTLRPTRLIIFGNPEGGTKFMQKQQQMGIDLPLKMLIWEEEDGDVNVSYYKSEFLADRYDIDDVDDLTDNVDDMLEAIVDDATK